MKLFIIKITSAGAVSWYRNRINEHYYAEWFGEEGLEYQVIRSVIEPEYIEGHYVRKENCEVLKEFEGRIVPTNTVRIEEL